VHPYRGKLVEHKLDQALFEIVTMVDATVIASASEEDGDGRWFKHKSKPAVHGFKAPVGADATSALVEKISVTPANINDRRAGPDALPDDPGEAFADSAYRGPHFGEHSVPGAGRPASSRPACGAATKPRWSLASRPGASRSTVFVPE
jgi:IS5 family transposase